MDLWKRRIGTSFDPFSMDNYIVQTSNLADFASEFLIFLFKCGPTSMFLSLVNCTTEIWATLKASLDTCFSFTPLFYWPSSLKFFPSLKYYCMLPILPMLWHRSLNCPLDQWDNVLSIPQPLTCTLIYCPSIVVKIKWASKPDILSVSLSIFLHRFNF